MWGSSTRTRTHLHTHAHTHHSTHGTDTDMTVTAYYLCWRKRGAWVVARDAFWLLCCCCGSALLLVEAEVLLLQLVTAIDYMSRS